MNAEKRPLKWALVIVPVVASALAIYPPHRKLKAGIDLAGGSSLLFEIDTTGLAGDEKTGLATRVMEVLKRRVDPNGQMNLIWRPIGNNRLEIQMPRPSAEALERRKTYEAARSRLVELNISRLQVEAMLHAAPDRRQTELELLAKALPERRELLNTLVVASDALRQATENESLDVENEARGAYEQALEQLLATRLDLGHFEDILALENKETRETELEAIRAEHTSPTYREVIAQVVERYDAWAQDKGVLEDPSDLKRRLRGAGVLEFRILAERNPASPTMTAHTQADLQEPIAKFVDQLHKRGPRPRPGDRYQWFEVVDVVDFANLDSMQALESTKDTLGVILEEYTGRWYVLSHAEQRFGLLRDSRQKWKLDGAFSGIDSQSGGPAVNFQLDARGGSQFAKLTGDNLNRSLAIMLDNVAQSYATIQSMIRQNGQITGNSYTRENVSELVAILRAGSLPARLIETPLMEVTIGPSLGEHNRTVGTRAAIYGGLAVGIFIIGYYRFAGLIANVALAMNLLFVLAIMAMTQATFTLPGIAALILTVGMAVDANVLIFERIREEVDRGVNLRKALRLGYERAFSTIVDANVTTLITCVVLGYLGTQEVKGFAMVLGFGIVTSMFTSLFVTRLIFTSLIDAGMLKSLPMMRLFRKPNIDWLGLRRIFWPVSVCVVVLALGLTTFLSTTDREALYDIEFLGGTSVQFELKQGQTLNDEQVRTLVSATEGTETSAVMWLRQAADALGSAQVARGADQSTFTITSRELTAEQLEALMRKGLEPKLERGGFKRSGNTLSLDAKVDAGLDEAAIREALAQAGDQARDAANRLANARIQTIRSLDADSDAPDAFEVITVETNKALVEAAILAAMGPRLKIERAINFQVVTNETTAPDGYWPIEEDDQYLSDVIEEAGAEYDIRSFKGGAVILFDRLKPPISIAGFEKRVRQIQLLPEFSQYQSRPFRVIGLDAAGMDGEETVFSKLAYVVVDEHIPYYDDPNHWEEFLAQPQLRQVSEALGTEKSLRKVIQFAPQVAAQAQQQAVVAIVLALAAIVAYVWVRFGQMQFGLAAIVALVHDVSVTLGLVAVAHYVHGTIVGRALGLSDFKIDLPMIAAFLTIIGYSLNDTIVIFDRIRENRGKLKTVTPAMINNSINQCLSRTALTSFTTFLAVGIMYVFGGSGIHGFSFALLAGIVVGTYSSVGIAAPLLQRPKVLHTIVYLLIAASLFGGFAVMVGELANRRALLAGAAMLLGVALIWAIALETRSTRRAPALAGARA